ncbi:MAG: PASTA domain-containing protein [Chlorobi bacterium]|nr:PASTA domain-containing protein [Chlorobiota bacterium]
MSFGKFLLTRVFWKNLFLAVLLTAIILFLVWIGLMIYTRHGQQKSVPDFYGLSLEDAGQLSSRNRFELVVQDSVYTHEVVPGHIVDQLPHPGKKVKKGRKIFLTVNAMEPEILPVPNVVGYSLRQAKAMLETNGFRLGELKYVPDLAINNVLKQFYRGKEIQPGDSAEKGSIIDLVLGKGLTNEKTPLPDFTGLSFAQAEQEIISNALNVGAVVYDETVTTTDDSALAFIWKQIPEYSPNSRVPVGTPLYLWLTIDSTKLPVDTLNPSLDPLP